MVGILPIYSKNWDGLLLSLDYSFIAGKNIWATIWGLCIPSIYGNIGLLITLPLYMKCSLYIKTIILNHFIKYYY